MQGCAGTAEAAAAGFGLARIESPTDCRLGSRSSSTAGKYCSCSTRPRLEATKLRLSAHIGPPLLGPPDPRALRRAKRSDPLYRPEKGSVGCSVLHGPLAGNCRPNRISLNSRQRAVSDRIAQRMARGRMWSVSIGVRSIRGCGGRFLREPVSSPLRPHHPCYACNQGQCRRGCSVSDSPVQKTTPESGANESSVVVRFASFPGRPHTHSQLCNFGLQTDDPRDITDLPRTCQPD